MEDFDCSIELSPADENLMYGWMISSACIGILTSFFAALSLIPKCNLLVFRIVLYAMIANGLHITVQLVEVFPVHNINGTNMLKNSSVWELACKSFGFLDQVTAWMGHLCMTWVIVYLIYLLIKKKRIETAQRSKEEIAGLAVCFLVPFVFNWIPFLNNYYGFSGSFCWIRMTANNGCSITEGLTYIIVLYYGPLLLFVLFNFVSCVFLFCGFYRNPKYHSKEFLFVLLYPFCYGMLFIIVFLSRISVIRKIEFGQKQSFSWWMALTVVDPLSIIFPSVLVFVSVSCSSLIAKREARTMNVDVNGECDEKTKLVRDA